MEIQSTKNNLKIQRIMKEFWKKKTNFTKVKAVSIEPIWFYLEDGEIIGFINGSISDYGNWKSAEITNLEIKKDFQKKGYGKDLINKFINYCKEKQVLNINLRVEKDNLIAKKTYENFSFKEDKTGLNMNLKLN